VSSSVIFDLTKNRRGLPLNGSLSRKVVGRDETLETAKIKYCSERHLEES
jgi:hypothetical protein